MTHAILIIGHGTDISQCLACIKRYNKHPDFRTFIHWDTRHMLSDEQYRILSSTSSVKGIYQEYAPNWGAWSLAQTEYLLFRNALVYADTVEYIDYFHCISADSMMLRTPENFAARFAKLNGKNLVPWRSGKNNRHDPNAFRGATWKEGDDHKYYEWDKFTLDHSAMDKINVATCSRAEYESVYIQSLKDQIAAGVCMEQPPFTWYWCSQWASLTYEACRVVVESYDELSKYLWRVKMPDETFIATALMNSHLASTVINRNIMYFKWNGGLGNSGATENHLLPSDAQQIAIGRWFFARKFGHDRQADARFWAEYNKQLVLKSSLRRKDAINHIKNKRITKICTIS